MLISHYVSHLQSDLTRIGSLGGEEMSDTCGRIADVLEPSFRSGLLDALNQLLAEVNESNPTLRLELRLAGDEVSFVRNEPIVQAADAPTDLNARFALRLPEDLKSLIDDRANRSGASTNSWIVKALSRELGENISRAVSKPGRNLRGSGQS